MKKLITIVLALFAFSIVQAQRSYLSNFYAGLNSSAFSSMVFPEHNYGSGDYYDHLFTLGFSGGLTLGLTVNDVHSFQLDMNYSMQGQDFVDTELTSNGLTSYGKKVDLTYIQLPLVYKYTSYFDSYSASSPSFFIAAGFYTAILQDGSVKYYEEGTEISFVEAVSKVNNYPISEPLESKDLFTPYDFGAVLALGFEIPLISDLSFTVESHTQIGLTDINSIGWRYPTSSKGYRPSLNIITGLKFGLLYNLYL